jgi:hypothetical protein
MQQIDFLGSSHRKKKIIRKISFHAWAVENPGRALGFLESRNFYSQVREKVKRNGQKDKNRPLHASPVSFQACL